VRARHGNNLRFLGEIEPSDGIERIEVDPHDHLQVGRGKRRDVDECIHRAFAEFFSGLDVHGLFSRYVYGHEGIEVEVGFDGDRARAWSSVKAGTVDEGRSARTVVICMPLIISFWRQAVLFEGSASPVTILEAPLPPPILSKLTGVGTDGVRRLSSDTIRRFHSLTKS
jgi:hypothetical protein